MLEHLDKSAVPCFLMSDPLRRALRTFVQGFLGVILTSGVLSAVAVTGVVERDILEKVLVSAIAAGVIAALTFVQNALEDRGTIPAVLKAHASSGANPVTIDPEG